MTRRWVEVKRWPSGEAVLVPIEYVATYAGDCGADYAPLVVPITNGLGAGLSRDAAIAHGLLELLQRDGNGLQIRSLATGLALDQNTIFDPIARDLLSRFDAAGVDIEIKVASTQDGFVNLYVAGIDRDEGPNSPLMSAAGGEASHPVAVVALRKALLEWAASRSRLAFMHGPLSEVEKFAPPSYLATMRARFSPGAHEKRALDAMTAWSAQSLQSARNRLMERVLRVEKRVSFDDLPSAPENLSDDKSALCREVAARLESSGFEVLVADFSSPSGDGEVFAVKVIAVGLEVETLSYGRVGARGAARLLERDDVQLLRRGEPFEGGRRVWLLPDVEASLGGPLWLDWPAVEALVGPLYALHREPGRHAGAFAGELAASQSAGKL
jgi:ribosomal protein S12 methylthiotransferase accessory factor